MASKPKPINHSTLVQYLNDFENTTPKMLSAYIGSVIRATSGGVVEEGGQLVETIITAPGESITPVPVAPLHSLDLPKTGFILGKKSLTELKGVNEDLVKCVRLALGYYTRIDFTVFDGIRTVAEQASYVKAGTSKTMKSKHLDGLAVDLVPIIGGIVKWDWVGCYEIACAMDKAATELGIADRITWGGAWDKTLDQFSGEAAAYAQAVESYKARHPGPDFIDGPHFEIHA